MKGQELLVPAVMRRKMMDKIHYSHVGADSCLRKARDVLFWPGMAKAVHDYICKCAICNEFRPQQQKEPLIPRNTPKLPWADVAVDLFTFDSDKYVVAVDYFSDFFVLDQLQDTTTTSVVEMLKRSFATHGIPVAVRTDGPQLVSEEFQDSVGNKRWLLGRCIKMVAPPSYVVEVNGVRYRRNRSFLRSTCEESTMYDSYVWDLYVPNVPAPCAPNATSSVENSQAGLRRTRTRVIKTPQRFRDYGV